MTRRDLFKGAGATAALRSATAQNVSSGNAKVKIGVVGGGFGSSFQWRLHPDCSVAAVCDIRSDRLQRLSEVYRCPNTYKDFRTMLKHGGLNAVAVFTPPPLHVWMAVESMKAGKHVISAVPAGMSVEELEELLDTVKRTGLRYMMAETSYYRPEVITCREWARAGKFGTIYYSEAEYHHEGLIPLMFDQIGNPTWRHGLPPMHYPTHCTGIVVPVTGERLTEVTAIGWGDAHPVLKTNQYQNPFWAETAFFKTSGGHAARISVSWHIAAGGTERGLFYGDRMSYIMSRPEGSPNTVFEIRPEGVVNRSAYNQPDHFERLPEPMRVKTGHGNSHTFLTHEFVRAIIEDRHPAVNAWEAVAYTLPGIIAHRSALKGGECMKIRDYGAAPA
jgi:predicted dehydrogenase